MIDDGEERISAETRACAKAGCPECKWQMKEAAKIAKAKLKAKKVRVASRKVAAKLKLPYKALRTGKLNALDEKKLRNTTKRKKAKR